MGVNIKTHSMVLLPRTTIKRLKDEKNSPDETYNVTILRLLDLAHNTNPYFESRLRKFTKKEIEQRRKAAEKWVNNQVPKSKELKSFRRRYASYKKIRRIMRQMERNTQKLLKRDKRKDTFAEASKKLNRALGK